MISMTALVFLHVGPVDGQDLLPFLYKRQTHSGTPGNFYMYVCNLFIGFLPRPKRVAAKKLYSNIKNPRDGRSN
jgi:hypothetical protein